MKKKKNYENFIFYCLGVFIFLRFFFDGISYPEFNFITNIFLFFLFLWFVILKRFKINFTIFDFLFFLFFLFSILSSQIAEIKGTGIRFNSNLVGYFFVFFLIHNIYREKEIMSTFKIIFFVTFFISIYGIYQNYWGLESTRKWIMENPQLFKNISPTFIERMQSERIFSTFLYPNIYASFLISIMPLLFFTFFYEFKNWFGIFSLIILIISFWNLILTGSIGGLLVFLFVFHIIFLWILLERKIFKRILPFLLIFEILSLFLGYYFKFLPHIHSLIDRIGYWKASIKIVKINQFFGIGPENFKYYFLKFKLPESMEAKHAHNLLIEILIENGLIGIVIFILFLALLIIDSFKNEKYFLAIGFLLISFFIHNLIDFDFYDPSVGILFFIFGGIVAIKGRILINENLTKWLLAIIIFISGICTLKLIKYENSQKYINYSEKEKNLNLKKYLLDEAENWERNNFEVYFKKGEVFLIMWQVNKEENYLKQSIENYNKSLALNPYLTKSYRRLGYIYEYLKEYEKASKMFLNLIEIYPNKKLYNMEVALFYKRLGDNEKFNFFYQKSKNLKPVTIEESINIKEMEKWMELHK